MIKHQKLLLMWWCHWFCNWVIYLAKKYWDLLPLNGTNQENLELWLKACLSHCNQLNKVRISMNTYLICDFQKWGLPSHTVCDNIFTFIVCSEFHDEFEQISMYSMYFQLLNNFTGITSEDVYLLTPVKCTSSTLWYTNWTFDVELLEHQKYLMNVFISWGIHNEVVEEPA